MAAAMFGSQGIAWMTGDDGKRAYFRQKAQRCRQIFVEDRYVSRGPQAASDVGH
jgi:hypothetical protein